MKYAVIWKSDNTMVKLTNDGTILFDTIEELEKQVKRSYLYKSDREFFCKKYTIAEVDIKPLDYNFIYKTNKVNTDKITKTGFKKAVKDFINNNDCKQNHVLEYGNIKIERNEYSYLVYVKNVTYTEINGREDVLINSGEKYLYLNRYYKYEFTNNSIESLYDIYVKQNATTNNEKVFYLNSDRMLTCCSRSKWY